MPTKHEGHKVMGVKVGPVTLCASSCRAVLGIS